MLSEWKAVAWWQWLHGGTVAWWKAWLHGDIVQRWVEFGFHAEAEL